MFQVSDLFSVRLLQALFDDFGDTAMIGVDEFIKSQEKKRAEQFMEVCQG